MPLEHGKWLIDSLEGNADLPYLAKIAFLPRLQALEIYNKADKREMGANHIETVKAKLAEVLA